MRTIVSSQIWNESIIVSGAKKKILQLCLTLLKSADLYKKKNYLLKKKCDHRYLIEIEKFCENANYSF